MVELARSIADELEIRDVVLAISLEADTGHVDDYGALYTDDAVVVSPSGTNEGKVAIIAANSARRSTGIMGPGTGARHHVVPGLVVVDGDLATVRSLFAFYVRVDGAPQLARIGEYQDELRREGTRWKMVRRTCTFD